MPTAQGLVQGTLESVAPPAPQTVEAWKETRWHRAHLQHRPTRGAASIRHPPSGPLRGRLPADPDARQGRVDTRPFYVSKLVICFKVRTCSFVGTDFPGGRNKCDAIHFATDGQNWCCRLAGLPASAVITKRPAVMVSLAEAPTAHRRRTALLLKNGLVDSVRGGWTWDATRSLVAK
jgi:hypothetical protein